MVLPLTQEILEKSPQPIIIKAYATWCPHCTRMKPIFEQVAGELSQQYIFAEFDIEKAPSLATRFTIKSLPTFIFIKDKQEVGREVGSMSTESLKKLITRYLQ